LSLFQLFNIGNSVLYASQAGLSVASNNIANANTPGYSKQDVVLSISNPIEMGRGFMGMGVTVSGIRSSSDRFLQAQLLDQQQNTGRSVALEQTMSQVEQIFNEAQGLGLSTSLTDYFNAWNDVASDPASQTPRSVLLQKAGVLVVSAQRMENRLTQTLQQINMGVDDAVRQVNEIASDIAGLNDKIIKIEAGHTGARANDFRDQRDELMNQLSTLVGNSSFEDQDGALTVTIGMKNLVAGTTTNTLSTTIDTDGNKQLALDRTNITSNISSGKVSGLIDSASEVKTTSLFGLRKLVASVTKEINLLHETGYGLDGTMGNDFFNALQVSTGNYSASASITASITNMNLVSLDEYTIGFAAGNFTVTNNQTGAVAASGAYVSGNPITFDGLQVTITGAVTSADSFTVSPLTDAIKNFGVAISDTNKVAASDSLTQLPGNNVVAQLIAQEADTAVSDLGNGTFAAYYQGLVSTVGSLGQAASDSRTFDENLLTEITKRRDSVSGVSLDEEAANLLRYQRAYEAGAKMIQIADELMQTVLNL
jgi:flagellar hook-associated protein 1 FlgK